INFMFVDHLCSVWLYVAKEFLPRFRVAGFTSGIKEYLSIDASLRQHQSRTYEPYHKLSNKQIQEESVHLLLQGNNVLALTSNKKLNAGPRGNAKVAELSERIGLTDKRFAGVE
ncbi:hypothetical protein M8C21_005982, partial [Ambrosia artemisiifolia]